MRTEEYNRCKELVLRIEDVSIKKGCRVYQENICLEVLFGVSIGSEVWLASVMCRKSENEVQTFEARNTGPIKALNGLLKEIERFKKD